MTKDDFILQNGVDTVLVNALWVSEKGFCFG